MAFWDWAFFIQVCLENLTIEKKTGERFESAPFHYELWEKYFSGEDALAIISRGHGKTTNVSIMATIYALIFDLEPSILIIATKSLGEEIVGKIREELEHNNILKFLFGDMVPKSSRDHKGKKWRGRELELLNGNQVKSVSKGEAIRGKRPTKIAVDDPEEDKDVKNPIITAEFYNWIFTTVYPTLADGGTFFVLGTMISPTCFVNRLKQQAALKGIKLIEYSALLDFDPKKDIKVTIVEGKAHVEFLRGTPLWPERWSLEKLAERCVMMMEDGKDYRKFVQEYFNIPFVVNASPVFSESIEFEVLKPSLITDTYGIQHYRPIDQTKQYSIGIDVSKGGVKGDYQAIVVRDFEFRIYRVYRGHVDQVTLVSVLDEIIAELPELQYTIVVENNYAGTFLNEARDRVWFGQLYKRVVIDRVTQKETDELGWNTNAKTKIILINDLDKIYKLSKTEISEQQLEEIQNYYHDEKGGMNALAPYHDDLVIADGCCIQGVKKGIPDASLEIW